MDGLWVGPAAAREKWHLLEDRSKRSVFFLWPDGLACTEDPQLYHCYQLASWGTQDFLPRLHPHRLSLNFWSQGVKAASVCRHNHYQKKKKKNPRNPHVFEQGLLHLKGSSLTFPQPCPRPNLLLVASPRWQEAPSLPPTDVRHRTLVCPAFAKSLGDAAPLRGASRPELRRTEPAKPGAGDVSRPLPGGGGGRRGRAALGAPENRPPWAADPLFSSRQARRGRTRVLRALPSAAGAPQPSES